MRFFLCGVAYVSFRGQKGRDIHQMFVFHYAGNVKRFTTIKGPRPWKKKSYAMMKFDQQKSSER